VYRLLLFLLIPRVALAAPDPRKATVDKIIAAALAENSAHQRLAELTDGIGARLSGSPQLEKAVLWGVKSFEADHQQNVRAEKVMVPHWVRGAESGSIVAPVQVNLHLLALGGSSGTPKGGITAEVIAVRDFETLDALGAKVKGKIVLFDHAMPPFGEKGTQYGETVIYRGTGPARAAKLGAVAALVRSVTARSLRTPHTGATRFDARPIPVAAIATEDSALIGRLLEKGPVRVKLELGAHTLPDAPSANVVAEIVGREKPDEIVLIGGHLDSWDVGQGAHDDGAGVVMVMETLRVLRALDLEPRRTIRAVLFTNEENGLKGAFGYGAAHQAELSKHFAAIEADTGAFAPLGFYADANPDGLARLRAMTALLTSLGATEIEPSEHSGADLTPLLATGATLLGLKMDASTYFDYHHSEADTLDKVDPLLLQKDVATMAAMTWLLAEEEQALPAVARKIPTK